MASDDYEINWDDDDLFGGDVSFNTDFNPDPFAGKSFIGSLGSGFLEGLGGEVWNNEGSKMRTIRTILPSSFSTALDRFAFVQDRYEELAKEFKEENYETAKSLQNIASHLSRRMGESLPSSVTEGLDSFSQKDFSEWERDEEYKREGNRLESTEESEIESTIGSLLDSQSSMFASLGDTLNNMTVAATASLQSAIGSGNRQLVNIESSIRDMLAYQRNVQARMDQAKVNLMARSYVQDAKFYKFMEAGIHEQVKELKKVAKLAAMSDYEKTSELQQTSKYIRSQIYGAVGNRLGGLSNKLGNMFGESNRKGAYSAIGELVSGMSYGLDMTEGQAISPGLIGDFLGKAAAGIAVDQLPIFFTRGPGKRMVDALSKKYPEQADYIKAQVKQITDLGNIVSYASTSGIGIMNHLAENFQNLDEQKFYDYEDYLASLKPGQKPLPKSVWTVVNATGNRAKASINKFMSDVDKSRGTQYVMNRRDVKDLNNVGMWKEMNNITLNEVLPGLISRTNQILEQIRTGKDDVEAVSYNYMRGQFQTDSQKRVAAQADLMPHAAFQTYANNALALVDSVDPGNLLDPAARKAFAQRVSKDIDADKGFNPYYYLGNVPGISKDHLNQIQNVLKIHFGIADQDIAEYESGDSIQKLKKMTVMGTEEGRERLNVASSAALNMRNNFPNIAERIDLLRQTGNEQLLRDLGIIYTEDGLDKINMQFFHDRIKMHMDDPNNPMLKGMMTGTGTPQNGPTTLKTLGRGGTPSSPVNGATANTEALAALNNTMQGLNDKLANERDPRGETKVNFDSMTGVFTELNDSNKGILENTGVMSKMFGEMLEIVKSGGIMVGRVKSKKETREEEVAKKSLWENIKSKYPADAIKGGISSLGSFMLNNPLLLGSLAGGIGGTLMSNPMAAAGVATAGIGLGLFGEWLQRSQKDKAESAGAEPNEDEDLLDESGEPILTAAKKNIGDYIDAASGKVIKFWSDVKGPVVDTATKAVIGVRKLAGKIFGPDGRAVVLSGLKRVRDGIKAAYDVANPLGRLRSIMDSGKELVFQQDVYVKGEKSPRLRAVDFKAGKYFVLDEGGKFTPISGWNEINGAVYDDESNELISKEEYEAGLVTSTGQAVRNAGAFASSIVSTAAGMGRSLFDNVMGRFGYNKGATASSPGHATAASAKGSVTGVEARLDKIYRMMSQWSGIDQEADTIATAFAGGGSTGGPSKGMRLNSLEWKEKEAEKEEKHKVNEAIINISENMGSLGGGKEEKGEKKGIFGMITGLLGGMGGFLKKFIKNPIGTIGGMVFGSLMKSTKLLGKLGAGLFSGVLGIASPIYKLLKWGFTSLAGVITGKMASSGLGGLGGGRGRKGKGGVPGKGPKAKPGKGFLGKAARLLPGGLKVAGAAFMGKELYDSFSDGDEDGTENLSVGERDPVTGRYKTWTDKGMDMITNWLPTGIIADMGVGAILGDKKKALDDVGLFWGSDGKFFLSRSGRDAHEDEIRGVAKGPNGSYGQATEPGDEKMTIQKEMRQAMYGVVDVNSQFARRVMALENMLYDYVAINGNRASLKRDAPIDKILTDFTAMDSEPMKDANAVKTWFFGRFKPVFLIFNAAISVARMGDIKEYDRSKSYDVVQVIERVQESIGGLSPNPYNVDVRVDSRVGTMGPEDTNRWLSVLRKRLDKEFPKPKESVVTISDEAGEKAKAQAQVDNAGKDVTRQDTTQDLMGAKAAQTAQEMANAKFKVPKDVSSIDITDMVAGADVKLDPFTAVRLAIYGNIDNMSWRCTTVLRLERYIEDFIMVVGDDARFTGKSAQILELFRAAFRVDSDLASNNWMIWFRDRFLPVAMAYVKEVKKLRGMNPSRAWKQLSATNKAEIARRLSELNVSVDDEQKSVWEISAGPFPNSKSGTWSDKATSFLEQLDRKAQEARLKDPDMEDAKSESVVSNESATSTGTSDSMREKTQNALASVYGGGFASRGNATAADGNPTGFGTGGYSPNATMDGGAGPGSAGSFTGQANDNFNPEFIKKAGDDKGIKMSLQQGEQLMLNHLIKAGFRDNKVLAMALAMARKETGNYSATVENTNWSAATLKKYFKNIPDEATAQKVAAMSPAERAMYVYGRNPKAKGLGNTKPEDGWDYRGRGFFQLTGKANYERFKRDTGIDVVSNPRLVSEDPNVMAESAVHFLKNNKALKSIAQTGDFDTAVRGINGGNAVPATDERRKYYNDYLNKLRSGALGIQGGGEGDGADAATVDAPATPAVPEAADKNVPQDKISDTAGVNGTATQQGTVKEMMKEGEEKGTPSNVGNPPPLENAADLGPGSSNDAATSTSSAGSAAPTSNTEQSAATGSSSTGNNTSSSTVGAPSTTPTPPAVEKKAEPQQPAQANMPDRMKTVDEINAQLMAQNNNTLQQILQVLKQSGSKGSIVSMG